MAADHRSILPSVAGLPWWSALAIAVIATAIGIAFDAGSGDKELTIIFSALYVMGCVAAVLMVQQSAVFTTVVQPPLILFVSVPAAYWMFHGGGFPGLKAIAINCGYPLIERFPLMLFTAATVLLIGMIRWYLGMLGGGAKRSTEERSTPSRPTLVDKLGAMLSSALNRDPAHAIEPSSTRGAREQRSGQRPRRATAEARRAARAAGSGGSRSRSSERRGATRASAPSRSRHVRPTMDEAAERPRRRRPETELRDEPPRRRPGPDVRDERSPRRRPAPEWQDEPPRRRPRPAPDSAYGREPMPRLDREPRPRSSRLSDTPDAPPRRRPPPGAGAGRDNGTRHPVSQVRYRQAAGDEPGAERRTRPRQPRDGVDSWEYDI